MMFLTMDKNHLSISTVHLKFEIPHIIMGFDNLLEEF